jgi:hypothetical protein
LRSKPEPHNVQLQIQQNVHNVWSYFSLERSFDLRAPQAGNDDSKAQQQQQKQE